MKSRILIFVTLPVLIVAASSVLTYQAFSYYEEPVTQVVTPIHNSSITLLLPDQEYVISERDLDSLATELIIPTRDSTSPSFTYDSHAGIIKSTGSPQDYIIEIKDLRLITSKYVDEQTRSIIPNYHLRSRDSQSLEKFNLSLEKIYSTPINILLKDGSNQTNLSLGSDILKSVLVPTSSQVNIPPEIDRGKLISYILGQLTPKQKKYFNSDVTYQGLRRAAHSRFLGSETPVVLGVDDGPNSKGELAGKYLEVDLSQQKMYFFIDHALYKEYKVSTGYDYPTPVGEFHILNKAPKAFSAIYNVWMPYWMGFKYAGDVGAYLGLHEIAYAVNEKGKPVYNHGYYIGDMMTGGCVAMEPKDSREIYNLSDVGMLVRIVK